MAELQTDSTVVLQGRCSSAPAKVEVPARSNHTQGAAEHLAHRHCRRAAWPLQNAAAARPPVEARMTVPEILTNSAVAPQLTVMQRTGKGGGAHEVVDVLAVLADAGLVVALHDALARPLPHLVAEVALLRLAEDALSCRVRQ